MTPVVLCFLLAVLSDRFGLSYHEADLRFAGAVSVQASHETDAHHWSIESTVSRTINRLKSALMRLGIRGFNPKLRGAQGRLEALRTPDGEPVPPNMLREMNHDLARLAFIRAQMKATEQVRLERIKNDPSAEGHPMVLMLARIVGIGIETADMLAGQGEDGCGRVAQLSVVLLRPVEFARLTSSLSFLICDGEIFAAQSPACVGAVLVGQPQGRCPASTSTSRMITSLRLSPGPRMAASRSATDASTQTSHWRCSSASAWKATLPTGSVSQSAVKAAGVRPMRTVNVVHANFGPIGPVSRRHHGRRLNGAGSSVSDRAV